MKFVLKGNTKVVFHSDVHIGASEFDEGRFLESLSYVQKEKCYLTLGGDIVENSIISGKDSGEKLLEQMWTPTEQFLYAVAKYKPIAKAGRLLWSLRGNHEARTRREAMFDLSAALASHLGVPYLGIGGMVQIVSGANSYLGAVQHGSRNRSDRWSELNKMMELYPEADFVTLGHDHNLDARYVPCISYDEKDTCKTRCILQVRTGTYLGYADYARNQLFRPSFTGSPILHFSPKERKITADTMTLCWL